MPATPDIGGSPGAEALFIGLRSLFFSLTQSISTMFSG